MNTDSWSPITGIPTNEARQYAVGFASSNHGFLFGGLNGNGYLNDLWTYDPTTDIWTTATPMPSAGRSGALISSEFAARSSAGAGVLANDEVHSCPPEEPP